MGDITTSGPTLVDPHKGHTIEWRESHTQGMVYIDKICQECGAVLTSVVCSEREYGKVSRELRDGVVFEMKGSDIGIKPYKP